MLTYQKVEPPIEGWVKKSTLDAYIGVNLQRGVGVVLRDNNGAVILNWTRRVEANWNIHISKTAATMFALDIVRRMGYEYVNLERDSLLVIKVITVNEFDTW